MTEPYEAEIARLRSTLAKREERIKELEAEATRHCGFCARSISEMAIERAESAEAMVRDLEAKLDAARKALRIIHDVFPAHLEGRRSVQRVMWLVRRCEYAMRTASEAIRKIDEEAGR